MTEERELVWHKILETDELPEGRVIDPPCGVPSSFG
jgi:hypothetical protein